MMKNKILGFVIMFLLVITMVVARPPSEDLVFNQGLTLTLDTIDVHIVNTDLMLYSGIYDTLTGVKQDNSTICSSDVLFIEKDNIEIVFSVLDFNYTQNTVVLNASIFNRTGLYKAEFWCHNEANTKGGYTSQTFDVVEITTFGLWKEPTNWTFPIIYLIITALVLIVAFTYESQLFGIFGSLMLIFSYFIIGATSPILLTPLLIIGLLLGFKFATL